MLTSYERGRIAGAKEIALLLLEAKFGPPSPEELKQRLDALSLEQLRRVVFGCDRAQSLKELGLLD
jgi:hypothetical protein